jgi:hypothetical protein
MRTIEDMVKYWEMILKYAKKTVKRNKAKKELEFWSLWKQSLDSDFDYIDYIIKTALK